MILANSLHMTNEHFTMVIERNTAPRVIITVPHDGLLQNDLSGLMQWRSKGYCGRDRYVWPIAKDVVIHSVDVPIAAVRLLMSRAFVDGNRAWPVMGIGNGHEDGHTAFDDPYIASVYEGYHASIRRLVEESVRAYGIEKCLLIDLHGFSRQPTFAPSGGYDLILGTANKTTIHYGTTDERLAQFFVERNYNVFLPQAKPHPDGDPYSAGYTTRIYSLLYGINTIQIETAPWFRSKDGQGRGEVLAVHLAQFIQTL